MIDLKHLLSHVFKMVHNPPPSKAKVKGKMKSPSNEAEPSGTLLLGMGESRPGEPSEEPPLNMRMRKLTIMPGGPGATLPATEEAATEDPPLDEDVDMGTGEGEEEENEYENDDGKEE